LENYDYDSVWNENTSDSFINYGNIFVPDRARQYQRICNLLPKFSTDVNVLDICCGEGLLSFEIAKKSSFYNMYCYDGSPVMLENAKKHLTRLPNNSYFKHFDLLNFEQGDFPNGCNIIVSSLAVHHLNDKRKQEFYKFANNLLPKNGLIVIVDVILPMCKEAMITAADDWDIAAYKQSLNFTGSLSAYDTFKKDKWNMYHYLDDKDYMSYDMPSPLFDQLKWLNQAGFSKVDVLWMYAGHAIFYGIK
jgi:tRNA (cmo5U34)-methyltransferase